MLERLASRFLKHLAPLLKAHDSRQEPMAKKELQDKKKSNVTAWLKKADVTERRQTQSQKQHHGVGCIDPKKCNIAD